MQKGPDEHEQAQHAERLEAEVKGYGHNDVGGHQQIQGQQQSAPKALSKIPIRFLPLGRAEYSIDETPDK